MHAQTVEVDSVSITNNPVDTVQISQNPAVEPISPMVPQDSVIVSNNTSDSIYNPIIPSLRQICPVPLQDSTNFTFKPKRNFWRAAGEVVGLNLGLWAFDRYVLEGHYAYISWESIKTNFKHGFDWDNDHLSTNMFAHPYHGSMYFNAGRSNGFNYWQSELFAIFGSAMWEMFMECEYPSTNDIIATPIGGAALGEVFYRATDLILDDRATGAERFGREFASFLISPMRGLTRVFTGEAWKKRPYSGRRCGNPNLSLDVSLGARVLSFHDDKNLAKAGAMARINFEYGDRFSETSKTPYDYFVFRAELNAMKTQPLLSRVEIMGRLYSKTFLDNKKFDLSVGAYQHFDYFDSDTITRDYEQGIGEPCAVPYKLGTPASFGVGSMFRYKAPRFNIDAYAHVNGVILGGILSDFYRYYNRNYNWASGLSLKFGVCANLWKDRLSISLRNQFYQLYTYNSINSKDWFERPNDKPIDVQGDESAASFYHLEGQVDCRLWKQLYLTAGVDFYSRKTTYDVNWEIHEDNINYHIYTLIVDSKQLSFNLMLTYKF